MVFRFVGLTVYWTVVQCLVLEKWVLSLQLQPKASPPPLPPPRLKKKVRIVEPHENGGDLNLTDWRESAISEEKSEGNDFVIINNDNQKGNGDNLHKTDQSTANANYAESWTRCKNWVQNCYQRSMVYMRQLTPSQTEESQFVSEAVDVDEAGEGDAVEMEEGTIPKAYRNVAIVLLSLVLIFPILIDVYHTALRFLHGGGPSSGFPSILWRYLKTWMPSK